MFVKRSIPHRLLAVFLSLLMILALLPATAAAADSLTYAAVTALTSGKNYIITVTDGATAHAIDNGSMQTASNNAAKEVGYVDLSVSSGAVTTDDESLVWTVTSSGSGWLIKPAYGDNTNRYLYPGTSDKTLYLNTSQRAWEYNESELSYTRSSSTYYLQFNDETSAFGLTTTGSTITFYELTIEATGISLPETATIAQNDTLALTATLTPSDATSTVTWESSAEEVATVSDGVVTGHSAGTADITATANGHSATCTVTVSDTYKLVDTIASGGKYLIVSEYNGTNFALDTAVDQGYSNSYGYTYSGFTGAAIDFGNADTIKADMVWIITGSGTGCSIINNASDKYLESTYEPSGSASIGKLFLTDSPAEWTFASGIFTSVTSEKQLKYDTDALGSAATAIDGQAPNILFTVRSTGAAVKLYELHDSGGPTRTAAPAFEDTSYAMTSSTEAAAYFPLTSSYTAPIFKVYRSIADIAEASGVTAGLVGTTLTLNFDSAPTADATYYISATDGEYGESIRTAVTVKAYVETYIYTLVNSITSGRIYLIVTLNDGKYVAMKSETDSSNTTYNYLKYTDVTASLADTTITLNAASAAELEWVLAGSDASFTMYNDGAGKFAALSIKSGSSKYGMTLADAGESWTYSGGQFKYTGTAGTDYADDAYLYSSTTTSNANRYEFRANTASNKASTIYLYEKQVAVAAPDYLAFTSDVHYNGSANNLGAWLGNIDSNEGDAKLDENDLDYMGFCGDMADGSASENNYWNYAQTMLNTVANSSLIDDNDKGCIYTTGNHEYMNGNYGTTSNPTADRITRIGEAVKTDNYIIYCFGAAGSSQQFTVGDIQTLDGYLATAPEDIPIIILSHFPIHYHSGRTTGNADDLIEVLNDYSNVIFLWGHNHTLSDSNYGKIYTEDDSINYTSSGSMDIYFTYAAAGCMSDSEYGGGSANTKQKGMIMEVAPDGSYVTMTYYGLDGKAVGDGKTIDISENAVSTDARLSSLSYTLNGVTKTVPGFNPSTNEYYVTLPYGTADGSSITLAGTCSSKDAQITPIEGAVINGGAATASITVTAEDGTTTKTYTVHFTVSSTQGTVYKAVSDFTDGGEYIIAYVDNGTAYCLDASKVATTSSGSNSAPAAIQTVLADTITTSDENILWTVTKSGSGWYISPASGSNTSLKLYMGNGPRLYLDATGRAMVYNSSIISYTSSYSTYYLAYSGSSFAASTSGGSPIQLFKKAVEATGVTLPEKATVKVDRTVQLAATLAPTGATSSVAWSVVSGEAYASVDQTGLVTGLGVGTAVIAATANGHTDICTVEVTAWPDSDSAFLAFTSDTHYESGKTNNLDSWLTKVSDLYHSVDYMGFCGDIGSTASTSVSQYWAYVQDIVDTINSYKSFVTNGGIYTTGNHEMYAGPNAGGNYASTRNSNDTAKLLTQTGEAAKTDDYIIYAFGACNSGSSRLIQEFTEDQIDGLKAYLLGAPDDIPIFILSHYPLHYNGNRIVERSEDVIGILNDYDNAIFLWGHNHTDVGDFENGYDNILKADSVITTLNESGGTAKSTEIEFTYAPAGCMSDEEYPTGNGSAILGKGMIVEISDIDSGGKNVTMTYYDLDGETFTDGEKVTDLSFNIGASSASTYKLNVTAPAFDDVQYGYAQPAAKALTITSTGNTDATITSVSSSSTNFIVGGTGDTIPHGTSITSRTVRPAAGLTVGTYTATITVTYNGGATATATVSLTVSKADQAAPSSVAGVNPTSAADKGSITGVTTAMEYRKSDSSGWTACTGTFITGLEPGSYSVRYAGTGTLNPSPAITITINAYNAPSVVLSVTAPAFDDVQYGYAQPAAKALTITSTGNTDATITSVSSSSTNFIVGGTGDTIPHGTSITSRTVRPAAGLTVGTYTATITVTYNGGATATATVSLTVSKADQAAPSSVAGVNPTSATDKGSITGVTTAMEYRKSGSSGWTACTGTSITGLEPGSYSVRYAGTDTLNPSPAITITIIAYTSSGGPGGFAGGGGSAVNYTVTATQSAGGMITLSASSVASGGSVTVTVTPDKGYSVSDVLVNGVSVGAVTSYTIKDISADQKVTAVFGKVAGAADTDWVNPYSDVLDGEWYYDSVQYATEKGLFGGTSATTFEPGIPMSRAMLVTVLYRMDDKPEVSAANPFTDVPAGMWYTDAVLWARQHEIVTGYADSTFRPNLNLTREQLAVMLYNYAKYKGCDMTLGKDFDLQAFSDASRIADYARKALEWVCGAGLIKGKPGNLLAPQDGASRAEVATILKRFVEEIED